MKRQRQAGQRSRSRAGDLGKEGGRFRVPACCQVRDVGSAQRRKLVAPERAQRLGQQLMDRRRVFRRPAADEHPRAAVSAPFSISRSRPANTRAPPGSGHSSRPSSTRVSRPSGSPWPAGTQASTGPVTRSWNAGRSAISPRGTTRTASWPGSAASSSGMPPMMDSRAVVFPAPGSPSRENDPPGGERADRGQPTVTVSGKAGCGEHALVIQEHLHIGLAGRGKALHQHLESRFHPESMPPSDPASGQEKVTPASRPAPRELVWTQPGRWSGRSHPTEAGSVAAETGTACSA